MCNKEKFFWKKHFSNRDSLSDHCFLGMYFFDDKTSYRRSLPHAASSIINWHVSITTDTVLEEPENPFKSIRTNVVAVVGYMYDPMHFNISSSIETMSLFLNLFRVKLINAA